MNDIILKVAKSSFPKKVAAAIVKDLNKTGVSHISAVGPLAVNQAVKAIAIARGMMSAYGKDVVCFPTFEDFSTDTLKTTALNFTVTVQ